MRIRQWFAMACGAALIAGAASAAAQAGSGAAASDLDGLVEVKSQRFDHLYLRPGADFRGYTKVMLDPTQVTFAKTWLTDLNSRNSRIAVLQGTTAADADRIAENVRSSLRNVFSGAFRSAGYEIVAASGGDVLELSLRLDRPVHQRAANRHAGATQPRLYPQCGAGDARARDPGFHKRGVAGACRRPPYGRQPGRPQIDQDHHDRFESDRLRKRVCSLGEQLRRRTEDAVAGGAELGAGAEEELARRSGRLVAPPDEELTRRSQQKDACVRQGLVRGGIPDNPWQLRRALPSSAGARCRP